MIAGVASHYAQHAADTHRAEARCRAMGSTAHVIAYGEPAPLARLLEFARAELERLEARWSRFRAGSEVNVLNASCGTPVVVSRETFELVERAVDAWRATRGFFDPTLLAALECAGYDRDFALVASDPTDSVGGEGREVRGDNTGRSAGCSGVLLDHVVGAITLAVGTAFDPGGIGKGFAADLVAASLHDLGATAACVNVGGDLRVIGEPPGGAWVIQVDDPFETGTGRLELASGGIATSSRLRRAWRRGGAELHHLLDPRTCAPARAGLASVTVIAGEAWLAEALATAAFVAGPLVARDLLTDVGASGLLVHDDGSVEELPGIEAFRR